MVPLVTLAFATFVLLPLVVAFVAGDAVAGEVSAGTLKTVLSRSVGRTELFLSKAAAVGVYCLAASAVLAWPVRGTTLYQNTLGTVALIAANQADPDEGAPEFLRQTAADKVTALYASQAITAALLARRQRNRRLRRLAE